MIYSSETYHESPISLFHLEILNSDFLTKFWRNYRQSLQRLSTRVCKYFRPESLLGLTSPLQPSGSDSTGCWIELKLHALTYIEPYFMIILTKILFDHPRSQTNDFLIITIGIKNQNYVELVLPNDKCYTALESYQ